MLTATVMLTAAAQRWLYGAFGVNSSSGRQCVADQTDTEDGVEDTGFGLSKGATVDSETCGAAVASSQACIICSAHIAPQL